MNWWTYRPKARVAETRQRAQRAGQRLAKQGTRLSPVIVEGRTIARSFWGKAWCDNLESYRDYEHRLPRGRSYLRNRAVLDLRVERGRIAALVSGSSLYEIEISIEPLAGKHWSSLKSRCAGRIDSLIELLEGRLSDRVMQLVTHPEQGLFPKPGEIRLTCSCPDWADMCKHVAAVMYGVGARLDLEPGLLFALRGVDHAELILGAADLDVSRGRTGRKVLADSELASVFGIELAEPAEMAEAAKPPKVKQAATPAKARARGAARSNLPARRIGKKTAGRRAPRLTVREGK